MDGDYQLRELLIADQNDRTLLVSITNYNEHGYGRKRDCKIQLENGTQSSIIIEILDVEFDIPKMIKFEVPPHYTRLP